MNRLVVAALLAVLPLGTQTACKRPGPPQPSESSAPQPAQALARPRTDNAAMPSLPSLPYLASMPMAASEKDKIGVTKHAVGRAASGLTIYCSERTDTVRFLDLSGRTVHQIVVPDANCLELVPYSDTDFLLLGHRSIVRVDMAGTIKWRNDSFWHHAIDVTPGGDILALDAKPHPTSHDGKTISIFDNQIVVLDPAGQRKETYSLFELLRDKIPSQALDAVAQHPDAKVDWEKPADVLHANALVLLNRTLGKGRPGDVLVSLRHLDMLAMIDLRRRRVVWTWGEGELDGPHDPTVQGDQLLVFDNGRVRGWSRILRLDPQTARIRWKYQRKDPLFFSRTRGSVQPLPNGNLLVAESDRGRLLEIDARGDVVWEFWNPDTRVNDKTGEVERRSIYRATRVGADAAQTAPWRKLLEDAGQLP